jgi:drug/metabolite transporter (DMT)-like permease
MFLGTPRYWWIMVIIVFVAALALIGTDIGGQLGSIVGILLLFLAMILFAAAPMRRRSQGQTPPPPETPAQVAAPAPESPPRPRPEIVGRDPSEV